MSTPSHFDGLNRPLVVTDTETTGTVARHNRIIEIGAIRVNPDGSRPEFAQLINPGVAIPRRITRITGITTATVAGEPSISDVLPAYLQFLGDGILVAHNLRFDESFLNAELARLELPPMKNRTLCTLKLARRLLPGLRSKSLGSLAEFFRIPSHGRHRALRDVQITVDVLERLLRIADYDHGIQTLDELLALQSRTYARVNPLSRHVERIREEVLPGVPAEPGVYRMLDSRGETLYIGKAKDLSKRIRSYFNAVEAHPPRTRELIGRVRDVEWSTSNTELEALIEESRLIKAENPSFNRALTRHRLRPYLRLGVDEPFPRLTAQVICRDDGAEYFGPLRSRGEARTLLEICERHFPLRNCDQAQFEQGKRCMRADIGRCPAPCEWMHGPGTGEERPNLMSDFDPANPDDPVLMYDRIVEDVRSFLLGDTAEIEMQIADDMERASAELNFEHAASFRDWLTLIDTCKERNGALAPSVEGPDRMIVRWTGSQGTAVLIRRSTVVGVDAIDPTADQMVAGLRALYREDIVPAPGLDREAADARRVVDNWTNAYRDEITEFDRQPEESTDDFAIRIVESLLSVTD